MTETKIFISYSWEDKEIARKIEKELKDYNIEIWIDYSNTRAGDILPDRISKALESCNTLLLLWSKNSINSYWVKIEYTNAIALKKRIIPCIIGNVKLPNILSNVIYIEFDNFKSGMNELLLSLKPSDIEKNTDFQLDFIQLIKYSENNFKEIKGNFIGERNEGEKAYDTNFSIHGADEKTIWQLSEGGWNFYCRFYNGPDKIKAEEVFKNKAKEIKNILSKS